TLKVNVMIKDSAPTNALANSIYTYVGFNAVLQTPTLSVSNILIDAGQYSTFTATITGGTSPYVANFIIANSVTNKPINSILITSASPSGTIYFPSTLAGNTLEANVVVLDSATTNALTNSIYTYLGFNAVLATPTITLTNTMIDAGQFTTITATESGGSSPYTANFVVSNTVTGKVVNSLIVTSAAPVGTLYFPSILIGNTLQVNVLIADSAPTNALANSIYTYVGFNAVLQTPTLSVSNILIDAGQYSTFTATITGGTSPYVANFIIANSVTNMPINSILITSASPVATLYFPSIYAGNTLE